MRQPFILSATIAASASMAGWLLVHDPFAVGAVAQASAEILLDNARVRIVKAPGAHVTADYPGAVMIALEDGPSARAGEAFWTSDPAGVLHRTALGPIVIVQPKGEPSPPAPAVPPAGSQPGEAVFTGMSFTPIFQNDRVRVLRARMELDAREGVHTHGADTIVVHLSGGDIEDTADGTTRVNHWKPGDVEFEAKGSSHSARNVGHPIDVVLVSLK